jgi:hypothetical protein
MRKTVVSFVAVIMLSAVFAMPASAGQSSWSGTYVSITVNFSDVVQAGEPLRGTVRLSTRDYAGRMSFSAKVAFIPGEHHDLSTIPLGSTTILRSVAKRIPAGVTKAGTFTHEFNSHVPDGVYTLVIQIDGGGDRGLMFHTFELNRGIR